MRAISTVDRGNEIGEYSWEWQWQRWGSLANCQQLHPVNKGTPQITHLALKTSSCSAPPPGHCELCVSLQEPSRSRNDSECALDERW